MEKSGRYYVFTVSDASEGETAGQVAVNVFDAVGTLRRIEAAGAEPLVAGTRIVAAGAAFLSDGEQINVAREVPAGDAQE